MRKNSDQLQRLLKGTETVSPPGALEEKLSLDKPLRVKLGLDPTAPAVTLGWAVVLRKLRDFQELGHKAVLIVGDFTAQVGDPSGKSETRRRLTRDEVMGYATSLLDQFAKVLLPEPLEIRYNSEWLGSLDMEQMLTLTSKATVAQMLERGDFAKRYQEGTPISVMEFMYPLLQGYDSVAVDADVELGGSDQLWNLMMGRVIQERYGLAAKVAMTVPLLVGTDGENKMSQSLGNYIGVMDPPEEIFGKTMSIPDHLMRSWYELTTQVPSDEIDRLFLGLKKGTEHPNALKRRLGREVTALYWGEEAAESAEERFDVIHKYGEIPEDIPEVPAPIGDPVMLPAFIREAGLTTSAGEARRLIEQGAVKLDGERIEGLEMSRSELVGKVLQVGKRRFARII